MRRERARCCVLIYPTYTLVFCQRSEQRVSVRSSLQRSDVMYLLIGPVSLKMEITLGSDLHYQSGAASRGSCCQHTQEYKRGLVTRINYLVRQPDTIYSPPNHINLTSTVNITKKTTWEVSALIKPRTRGFLNKYNQKIKEMI